MILNAVVSLLLSCWSFSFALGHGISFFGRIQHSPVDGCSAASCDFGALPEDECMTFFSTVLKMVNTEIRLIIVFAAKDEEPLYSQQKQDQEQIVAQIMNSLLQYSDIN